MNKKLKVIERGYNKQAVDILEYLLSEAKEGKVTSLVVTSEQDGEYITDYTGCDDLAKLVGVMDRQKHLILRRMDN